MYAWDATSSAYIGAATMGSGGTYTIDLPPGYYKLSVEPNTAGYPNQWFGGLTYASATPIAVSAATTQNITLVQTFTLSGTVFASDGTTPLNGTNVYAWTATTSAYIGAATMGSGGTYTIDLPPGNYKLYVEPNTAGDPDQWLGGSDYTSATPIAVSAATTQDITLTPHVLFIIEENQSIGAIIGNSAAPYINGLANQYGLATQLSDLSHPSLPNYLGLTSGSIKDNPQDTTPQDETYGGPSLGSELSDAGVSWKAYMEDMPQACDLTDQFGPGNYDVTHNPFMYYDTIRTTPAECDNDVPYTQLATDLAANALPDFMWITPNLEHDMHNGTIQQGDTWLSQQLPRFSLRPGTRLAAR